MTTAVRRRIGELLYGALFVVVLPIALAAWARALDRRLPLPSVRAPLAGVTLVALGATVLGAGMLALVTRGGGLPMNAFPPPRYVRSGVYRLLADPIYVGFGGIVMGVALFAGSPAGVFVVTPVVALAMTALVVGYERVDLVRRFGDAARVPPLLSVPRGGEEPATPADRAAVALWVLGPVALAMTALPLLAGARDDLFLPIASDRVLPIVRTDALVATAAATALFTTLGVASKSRLRAFALAGALASAAAVVGGVSAPALALLWTLLATDAWCTQAREQGRTSLRLIVLAGGVAVFAGALGTRTVSPMEAATASLLFAGARRPDALWARLRGAAERIANSWHEWRFGAVRVINHGAYAFAGALVCILVAGSALGARREQAVVWVGACIILGAGLWAQWLEGSSRLLRPFGWYGGVAGGLIGAGVARLAGVPLLPLLASFAVAAPWLQLLGRLRCLVQGCCHGGPASETVGIVYRHRRSRVTQLANLAGVPIHPTPLYSIIGNLVLGVLMARLRLAGAPDAFVLGTYLVLAGIARFIEESFRAEPQTPRVAGLPVYQWFAVAQLIGGAIVTVLPSAPRAAGFAPPTAALLLGALALATGAGFALGVDFPRSNARFSRLAAAD